MTGSWDTINNYIIQSPGDVDQLNEEFVYNVYSFEVVVVWIMWIYIFFNKIMK